MLRYHVINFKCKKGQTLEERGVNEVQRVTLSTTSLVSLAALAALASTKSQNAVKTNMLFCFTFLFNSGRKSNAAITVIGVFVLLQKPF